MSMLFHKTTNRRSLLKTCGRVLALCGLTAVGSLTLKNNTEPEDCIIPALCQECSIYNNCALPKAKSAQSGIKDDLHE